jgi:hypothetical protein
MAGAHSRDRTEKQNDEQKHANSQADQAKKAAAVAAPTVKNSAPSWIEYRHRNSP